MKETNWFVTICLFVYFLFYIGACEPSNNSSSRTDTFEDSANRLQQELDKEQAHFNKYGTRE